MTFCDVHYLIANTYVECFLCAERSWNDHSCIKSDFLSVSRAFKHSPREISKSSTYRVRSSVILRYITWISRTDPSVSHKRLPSSVAIMSGVVLPVKYVTIEEECKRNPEFKMSDLQMLKDWMDKQPHLPNMQMIYFVLFLHSNYYHLESTKKTIDNFFTVRTHTPEVFSNRDPIAWKELRKAFTVMAAVPLERKTKEGYIMTFVKLLDSDPSKFDYLECLKYLFMTCEVQSVIRGTNEGIVIVIDAAGASFGHIARINLTSVKKILYYVQEAIPVRLKSIHILNTMPIVDMVLNMIKPFAKAELLKLVHFHSNLETVQKFLSIETLPNEYGGKAGPIEEIAAKHIKLLEEFREWFQYDELVGRVNESLRVEKFHSAESLFGVDGSFKKLEID